MDKNDTELWNGAINSNDEAVLSSYDGTDVHEEDIISVDELHAALKEMKKTKVAGTDGINAEVLKCGGWILELHFLSLMN